MNKRRIGSLEASVVGVGCNIFGRRLDFDATSAGISNYSISRHGLTLFGYFETDDIEKTREYLSNGETNERWSEWMDPIMRVETDPTTDFPYLLPLQWHMD